VRLPARGSSGGRTTIDYSQLVWVRGGTPMAVGAIGRPCVCAGNILRRILKCNGKFCTAPSLLHAQGTGFNLLVSIENQFACVVIILSNFDTNYPGLMRRRPVLVDIGRVQERERPRNPELSVHANTVRPGCSFLPREQCIGVSLVFVSTNESPVLWVL